MRGLRIASSFFILKDPSASVPRRVKLLTFATSQKVKQKKKQLDKAKKLMRKCLRKAFAWNAKFRSSSQQVGQQYIELPQTISDPNGNFHKGQKSYTTKWLENCYKDLVWCRVSGYLMLFLRDDQHLPFAL